MNRYTMINEDAQRGASFNGNALQLFKISGNIRKSRSMVLEPFIGPWDELQQIAQDWLINGSLKNVG